MADALKAHAGEITALVTANAIPAAKTSQLVAFVTYVPIQSKYAFTSEITAEVPHSRGLQQSMPNISGITAFVVYKTGIEQEARSRAWAFTLDGHPFYVLDLGDEGTFLYDISTEKWCQWGTEGYTGWNMRNGTRWGMPERVVGGDTLNGIVWELDPTVFIDEGFRPITHIATTGMNFRERIYRAVEALRLAGSIGAITDNVETNITLEFSDDGGETYPYSFTYNLKKGDFNGVVEWRSLGSFRTPGRVFRITDVGGLLRIDGTDVYVDGWDDEGQQGGG